MNCNVLKFLDFSFSELSLDQWYKVVRLRERVFVVEQNCPYLDADNKDQRARHVMGLDGQGALKAYARIVHPEDQPAIGAVRFDPQSLMNLDSENVPGRYSESDMPSIGRVVLDPEFRGKGWGDRLMKYTMECCQRLYPGLSIFISAQEPLQLFYERLGFEKCGEGYLEDGIPHIPMVISIHLEKD